MRLDLVVDVVDHPMLQSGSTSILGRAYGVDDILPLPVPAGSGGVVDLLGIPAARRRGGGDGGRNSAGLRLNPGQRYVEKGEMGGAATSALVGWPAPSPCPSFYRWRGRLGQPPKPIYPQGGRRPRG